MAIQRASLRDAACSTRRMREIRHRIYGKVYQVNACDAPSGILRLAPMLNNLIAALTELRKFASVLDLDE
jgi:hypothetical protein